MRKGKPLDFITNNLVTLIFVVFTFTGFAASSGATVNYFLSELSERLFRNAVLVISLIIPVVAGLGLNFGIVIGAMSGQLAIIIVRYWGLGGFSGLILCFLISVPFSILFGVFTGMLYNKTRGQEMIASLIVSYFATGLYLFVTLYAVGGIIPVDPTNPLIIPTSGMGIRMSVDLIHVKDGGLKYALDSIFSLRFVHGILIVSIFALSYILISFFVNRKNPLKALGKKTVWIGSVSAIVGIGVSLHAILTNSKLMLVRDIPVATAIFVIIMCLFTHLILKTKLGQDFRSVGQNQHIAKVSGIDVDRTRIIATVISTVLAAWGMIIYLQNMGTLSTYTSHTQIGIFSVAALLVGGASTQKASVIHAIIGTLLFNAMFIMSQEIGQAIFGNYLLGEYFRTFMAYGAIGVALGIYVWKARKRLELPIDTVS